MRTIIVQPSHVELNERPFRNWDGSLFTVYITNEYARVFGRHFGNSRYLEKKFKAFDMSLKRKPLTGGNRRSVSLKTL